MLCGATYPAAPSSTNPTIGSPHANAYTFSRLIFSAIFGKHKSPAISAIIANPKIEYRYSSWENTDEDQAVQDVFDTDEDNEYFRSWTEDDTAYFAVDPGYGTIEVGEDSSIEPGIYSMFALDDTVLKIRIVSGSTEEIYDVEGTGSVETVDLEDGDEIIFQEYSETTDTLYLVKDLENK